MSNDLPENLGKRLGNLQELPEELRKQIPSAKTDELEREILFVLENSLAGVGTVDEVLVALYRKNGKIGNRQKIAAKLYRMTSAKYLEAVAAKRGVYRIIPEEEPAW